MNDILLTPLRLNELESLIRNSVQSALDKIVFPANSTAVPHNQILNITEAAEMIKLSVPIVYGLVSRAEIPYSKRGKRLYFLSDELVRWIKTGRAETKKDIADRTDEFLATQKSRRKK